MSNMTQKMNKEHLILSNTSQYLNVAALRERGIDINPTINERIYEALCDRQINDTDGQGEFTLQQLVYHLQQAIVELNECDEIELFGRTTHVIGLTVVIAFMESQQKMAISRNEFMRIYGDSVSIASNEMSGFCV